MTTLRHFDPLTFRPTMSRVMREPLVHFLLLGAVLFGVYTLAADRRTEPSAQIVVTQAQIEQLMVGFTRTWQRPPTQEELEGLIEDRIREEVLYREAVAMGLDRGDSIVRRRMRQKLEFLTEDLASQFAPPTEQELETYLDRHADTYREETKVSFEHIAFSRDRRGKSTNAAAAAALAQLNGENGVAVDLDSIGDATLLSPEFHLSTRSEIARMFGEAFSKQVLEVETGGWSGPIESAYGLHLVRIRERVPGRLPELASVRALVARDLLAERRTQTLEAVYAELRRRYSVKIEKSRRVEGSKSQRVAAK